LAQARAFPIREPRDASRLALPLALALAFAALVAQAIVWAKPSARPAASAPASAAASAVPHLVEDGHYRNSDGAIVHSPAHTDTGTAPSGASAQCRDGTYSFSAHRRGTCSHHGGVARWL
jgi:hypothetical protein